MQLQSIIWVSQLKLIILFIYSLILVSYAFLLVQNLFLSTMKWSILLTVKLLGVNYKIKLTSKFTDNCFKLDHFIVLDNSAIKINDMVQLSKMIMLIYSNLFYGIDFWGQCYKTILW